jgi:polar amino acid transport system substrate-binding protein
MVAASVANTEERRENVDFSDPYFVGFITVLAAKDSGITEEPGSLSGKRLGLVQGTIQDDYAQANFDGAEIVRFPDNNSAIAALNSGTVDAHFLDFPVAQDYADASDGSLVITVNVEMDDFPVGFPIAKGQDELKEGLNEGIQEVLDDGSWLEIKNEYFPDQPLPEMFEHAG